MRDRHQHVVFGTDWPWYERPEHGSDPELGVLGPDRAKVDWLDAAVLVPRLVERMSERMSTARS